MLRVRLSRFLLEARTDKQSKPFPRIYFDLKAFRKGIAEKKQSLIQAEKREIDRVYAKPPPDGWDIPRFLREMGLHSSNDDDKEKFYSELAACFDDWNDFISSSRKDLFRVSNLLSQSQLKKLAHYIELYNHGLFPPSEMNLNENLRGKKPEREGAQWTVDEDELLIELATNKYDYKFGDPWIYIGWEMGRSLDEVESRFADIFLKLTNQQRKSEVVISKSFRPLLLNRQFRVIPPQCYIVPSEENFPSKDTKIDIPNAFNKYRATSNH